jgi:PadR family transcriptional regulator AphA
MRTPARLMVKRVLLGLLGVIERVYSFDFSVHNVNPIEKKGQTRKIYRLTKSGRQILKKWVDEPSPDAQVRDEQMVKVLCFDLLSRDRITEHLQRIREHHAAKLFYSEDSLKQYMENRPKQVRLGPLLTLHRGILAARAYVQWCDEALSLVARAERKR